MSRHIRTVLPALLLPLTLGCGDKETPSFQPVDPTLHACEGGTLRFPDADGDGYGDDASPGDPCLPASDSVEQAGDCDDTDANINPGQEELCNGVDDDCDGEVDPGLRAYLYVDGDRDGFGSGSAKMQCVDGADSVEESGDCDDTDPDIHPGAAEVCDDDVDNDCDELLDCLDSDCSSPSCEEVCDDGWDNDADGLMDCEDADCVADDRCIEICGDYKDNDQDGLTDCEDDDCALEWDCMGVDFTYGSGQFELTHRSRDWMLWNSEVPDTGCKVYITFAATNFTGTARGPIPASPSVETSCTWRLDRVLQQGREVRSGGVCGDSYVGLKVQSSSGLEWSPDCPWDDRAASEFFPSRMYARKRSSGTKWVFGTYDWDEPPYFTGLISGSRSTTYRDDSGTLTYRARTSTFWGQLQGSGPYTP